MYVSQLSAKGLEAATPQKWEHPKLHLVSKYLSLLKGTKALEENRWCRDREIRGEPRAFTLWCQKGRQCWVCQRDIGAHLKDIQWPKVEQFVQQNKLHVLSYKPKYKMNSLYWAYTDINKWWNKGRRRHKSSLKNSNNNVKPPPFPRMWVEMNDGFQEPN